MASLVGYNGSVLCEITRGRILALPKGQLEAAEAMGVRYCTTLVRVVLPRAVPAMLPVRMCLGGPAAPSVGGSPAASF